MHHNKHYLKTLRLSSGLTQDDVAFLLGLRRYDQISKAENHKQFPSLRLIFGYHIIFNADFHALIPGYFSTLEHTIKRRAKRRISSLKKGKHRNQTGHRVVFLRALAYRKSGVRNRGV